MIRNIGKHGSQRDYIPQSNFQIEINGVLTAGFQRISGLKQEVEVIEYRDGDTGLYTHARAGKVKPMRITCERGQINDPILRNWFVKVLGGETDRQSISIISFDRKGNEVCRYNLFEAWPCEWNGPELNSKGDAHQLESIVFVCERMEMVTK